MKILGFDFNTLVHEISTLDYHAVEVLTSEYCKIRISEESGLMFLDTYFRGKTYTACFKSVEASELDKGLKKINIEINSDIIKESLARF